jgi:hypothetical protein
LKTVGPPNHPAKIVGIDAAEAFLMADINLRQNEADRLITMEKQAVDEKEWLFPAPATGLRFR